MGPDLSLRRATPADVDYVERLLAENDLPTADVSEKLSCLYLCRAGSERVGVGGLEQYRDVALLRSVVIEEPHRGNGYGAGVCRHLLAWARRDGAAAVYLLTTTADGFFRRLGFEEVDRGSVPETIRRTSEFSDLCPSTAVCMTCDLSTLQADERPPGCDDAA